MMPERTKEYVIKGESRAVMLAEKLILNSVWFCLTPFPDDDWKFTLKDEHHGQDVDSFLES